MATLILRPTLGGASPWQDPYYYPAEPVLESSELYKVFDEETANDDDDYIYGVSGMTGGFLTRFFCTTDKTYGAISNVRVYVRFKYTGTPSSEDPFVHLRVTYDGSHVSDDQHLSLDGADEYHTQYADFPIPYTGGTWNWDMIHDSTQIAIQATVAADGVDYFRITQSYLVVTYTPLAPTVTTQVATNIKGNYCTGNGNVTDDGGANIIERGFEFGKTQEAKQAVRETGTDLGTGVFDLLVSPLEPETIYYYRAYATNSAGDGYGDWVSFTTSASSSYGVYEESNSKPDSETGIYANSNKICFYVRKVGGGWGMKHGPYTRDQADIAITQILAAQGKGKYQIKFTSDVLTGLSVSIMTKLDIKAR